MAGLITPLALAAVVGIAYLGTRESSIIPAESTCTVCERAGYRVRIPERERRLIWEQWFHDMWHAHVRARTRRHRLAWHDWRLGQPWDVPARDWRRYGLGVPREPRIEQQRRTTHYFCRACPDWHRVDGDAPPEAIAEQYLEHLAEDH